MEARKPFVDSESDEALMLRVQDGQVETLGELYQRHRTSLFNFFVRLTGNTHLSEDLVQEVFLRLLRYRHTFKAGNRFKTWMHQIARNARRDAWRRGRHESAVDTAELEQDEALWGVEPGPDCEVERSQEVRLLEEALAALPEESREVLVLSRFQGLKYEAVASVLGCKVGAVKMRVLRALRELRRNFSQLAGKERL